MTGLSYSHSRMFHNFPSETLFFVLFRKKSTEKTKGQNCLCLHTGKQIHVFNSQTVAVSNDKARKTAYN